MAGKAAADKVIPETEELPMAIVRRLVKERLSSLSKGGNISVQKNSYVAFSRSARIFIHYLTATAYDICKESKRQTINADDVVKALEDIDFREFTVPLLTALDDYRIENARKRSKSIQEKEEVSNRKRKSVETGEVEKEKEENDEEEDEEQEKGSDQDDVDDEEEKGTDQADVDGEEEDKTNKRRKLLSVEDVKEENGSVEASAETDDDDNEEDEDDDNEAEEAEDDDNEAEEAEDDDNEAEDDDNEDLVDDDDDDDDDEDDY